ncbi:MAG: diadenylate cyclase CdaA [Clostridia bacterium]|nr:diadenylate cyclase CdaA [Clostridia bacterium]
MESIIRSFEAFYDAKILGYINTLIDYPIKILALIIDITIVFYLILKLVKMIKGTRAVQLIKGAALLIIANALSEFLSLNILHYILNTVVTYGVLLFIVVFQPELRKMLEQMGSTNFKNFFDIEDNSSVQSVDEVVEAAARMASEKTGALIVFEKDSNLGEIIHTGVTINSDVSKEIIQNIFVPDTPLHDGAVVIRDNKIVAASCILPITDRDDLDREFGTRHRAAIGLSEVSDAVIIVVSEETGKISLVMNGKIIRNLSSEVLKKELKKRVKKNNIKDTQLAQKMKQITQKNEK